MTSLKTGLSGRANWGDNRLQPGDERIHDWYRLVLAFPPHLVRYYLRQFNACPGQTLLDPFCGTGTALVEGKKQGLNVIGLDVNPVACLAGRVKSSWDRIDTKELRWAIKRVSTRAEEQYRRLGLVDMDLPLFSKPQDISASVDLPHLSSEQERLLLNGSISPLPLAKLLVAKEAIESLEASDITVECLLLALANVAVTHASNLGFGPEVYVLKKKKTDAPVLALLENQVLVMLRDVEDMQRSAQPRARPRIRHSNPAATVIEADARKVSQVINSKQVHIVISSPPYPNEKDYTRALRLELVLLGYLNDRKDLRALKKKFLRSNTRGIYASDEDDRYLNANKRVEALAKEIETRRQQLGKTSGFERMYHQVVRQFFGGMARHLQSLKSCLAPGAHLAYVLGDQASFFLVHIDTAEIFAEIAQAQGYQVEGIELWRERRATASGALLKENVLILRWP